MAPGKVLAFGRPAAGGSQGRGGSKPPLPKQEGGRERLALKSHRHHQGPQAVAQRPNPAHHLLSIKFYWKPTTSLCLMTVPGVSCT